MEINQENILEYLFKKYGDFLICQYIGEKEDTKEIIWTKWLPYSSKQYNKENKKLLRSIYAEEIVLDIEDDNITEIKDLLLRKGLKYKLWKSGGRGYHFHLFFNGLKEYDESIRPYIKGAIIEELSFGRADQKKKDNKNIIGCEYFQHRKGNEKTLVFQTDEDFYPDNNLPSDIKEFIKTLPEKYEGNLTENIKPFIIFKDKKPCDAIENLIKKGAKHPFRNKYANFIVQQLRDYCGYDFKECLEVIQKYNSNCEEKKNDRIVERDLIEQFKRKYNINCNTFKTCEICPWKHQDKCSKFKNFNGCENNETISLSVTSPIPNIKESFSTFKNKEDFKYECFKLIITKKEDEATELITQYIEDKEKIYTTKKDEKNEIWIYKDGIYIANGESCIKEITRDILDLLYTAQRVNKVIAKIEADTYINEDEFFNVNILEEIPVLNGILNLKTLELQPYTPEKIFFNKVPVNYDKEAKCPKINTFFEEVLPTSEDKLVMYELFGYCLWKDAFLEQAVMLNGDGSNGKGKTLMLLKRFLGDKSISSISLSDLTTKPFVISELFGKLANIAGDISSFTIKDTGIIKTLTGRDSHTAQRKFLNGITFVNYSKQIFGCNELPVVYDTSFGFWRRWILLDFPFKFIDEKEYIKLSSEHKKNCKIKDANIVDKIATPEELSGLLNKAIEGLHTVLKKQCFSYTKGTSEVKDLWIRKSNSFAAFCIDTIEPQEDGIITKNELRKKFFKYCKKHKIKSVGDKSISITLENEFGALSLFPNSRGNNTNEYAWAGISWKKQTDE